MSEGEGRMNKMYQRLKRKCISLVLFALLVAFIGPYYAYAADNVAEQLQKLSLVVKPKRSIYIDAEGKLKGSNGHLDLQKCEAFIKNALSFAK